MCTKHSCHVFFCLMTKGRFKVAKHLREIGIVFFLGSHLTVFVVGVPGRFVRRFNLRRLISIYGEGYKSVATLMQIVRPAGWCLLIAGTGFKRLPL